MNPSDSRRGVLIEDWEPQQTRSGSGQRSAVRWVVLALAAVCLIVVGWSIGAALTAPGTGSTVARLAEWARDAYLWPLSRDWFG